MGQEKVQFFEELMKSKRYVLDLVIVILLSLITVIVVSVLPEGNIVRIVFGIVFLLTCPGYVLVSLLWPIKNDMSNLERLALSFGLSITIVIILGLVLNYTPWGLDLNPILFSLFGFVIIATLLSLYRRLRVPEDKRFFLSLETKQPKGENTRVDKILTILIVASLVTAGIILGYVVLSPKIGEKYSEFYILDKNGTTEDYPDNLIVDENSTLIVGIINHEGLRTNYTVQINLLNETEHIDYTWESYYDLNNTQKYEFSFNFNITSNGTYKLEFFLFREIDNQPYLSLRLNEIIVKD